MRRPRLLLVPLALLAALLLPATLGAHTDLDSTQPRDGAVLVSPPDRVVVTFTSPVARVTSGRIAIDGSGDVAGETRIDPADATRVLIDVDREAAGGQGGIYTASWSITALDGHTQDGEVSFEVRGAADVAGSRLAGAAAFVQERGR